MKNDPTHHRFKDLKIVYVDDEESNLFAFEGLLNHRFEILTFNAPGKALTYIETHSDVAVAILDQVMPQMTGLELAEVVKKIRPTLTCIMLTGNATKQLAIDSVERQVFYKFLEKPIDFGSERFKEILIEGIQNHLLDKTKLEFREGTLELLANLIDDKDGHTHFHSQRVAEWSVRIGKQMNMSDRDQVLLYEGALIHDLGKISIPDDILKKPGKLTPLERRIIMTHPGRGGDLIDRIPQLRELSTMARDHHERPDGKGYPRGLKGEDIPVLASIVALADFFEALSSRRAYKEPWEMSKIIEEIELNRGTQFREDVVVALYAALKDEGLWDTEVAKFRLAAVS